MGARRELSSVMGHLGAFPRAAAYLCYAAAPCDVAIAVSAVRRVLTDHEAKGLSTIDLGEPLGVQLNGPDEQSGWRVLLLEGLPQDRGILVPRGGSLVNAAACELLAMPAMFSNHSY